MQLGEALPTGRDKSPASHRRRHLKVRRRRVPLLPRGVAHLYPTRRLVVVLDNIKHLPCAELQLPVVGSWEIIKRRGLPRLHTGAVVVFKLFVAEVTLAVMCIKAGLGHAPVWCMDRSCVAARPPRRCRRNCFQVPSFTRAHTHAWGQTGKGQTMLQTRATRSASSGGQ